MPCLMVLEITERPITLKMETNVLVGTDSRRMVKGYRESFNRFVSGDRPKFWDGKASDRIFKH